MGPTWPFLLMYGSHDMRHTGFPQVDGLSTGPPDLEQIDPKPKSRNIFFTS